MIRKVFVVFFLFFFFFFISFSECRASENYSGAKRESKRYKMYIAAWR